MAKSLYSALFDWIVLRINHALLNKKDMEESVSVRATPPQLAACDPGCSRSGVRLVSPLSSPREPTGCGSQGPVQRKQGTLGLSCWSSGEDSPLPLQGAWVQSLVGELRSCRPRAAPNRSQKHRALCLIFQVVSTQCYMPAWMGKG